MVTTPSATSSAPSSRSSGTTSSATTASGRRPSSVPPKCLLKAREAGRRLPGAGPRELGRARGDQGRRPGLDRAGPVARQEDRHHPCRAQAGRGLGGPPALRRLPHLPGRTAGGAPADAGADQPDRALRLRFLVRGQEGGSQDRAALRRPVGALGHDRGRAARPRSALRGDRRGRPADREPRVARAAPIRSGLGTDDRARRGSTATTDRGPTEPLADPPAPRGRSRRLRPARPAGPPRPIRRVPRPCSPPSIPPTTPSMACSARPT